MLDNTLYRRTIDGLLLKCLGSDQSKIAMREVHEGICGIHQSAHKMKWLLRRAGFYWPTMLNDCFRYYKGCELCQKFRDVQLVPVAMLHPIIKSWPFCGWALDFVGQIHHTSSKCQIQSIQGTSLVRAINGKYLKKYYPSIWQDY
jgi:hypothetical protein